ncbi:D-glycero-beta-D-manno-heptose 1-phosphate adenylyltransferase [Pseudarthrobacter sp. BIM B-2242]|uniref:D-glycero-beta-D-manno-heptose 1-phosphate adenylyltransferase n=1 Tax=Pseudarthrobacter sp. BIM B-2242 TaxID=2772401 RepID=UPI00168AE470|nr:D-glycero-beta-D-manno-heptose 1-phosphate adenylyltransferase [Pseudarthrobacter sp. BIM B-2242]QOD03888.1 D-glycero-beta-D-manno-heptose 1-phosphate adenylyltransferase [Pseudarthrobacter sp. BIM B-2242]
MSIVVVGDVILDVDLSGEATRLSPDAPVPVVDVSGIRRRAGGAGLVARMLAEDGWPVTLVTVLADDDAGRHVEAALAGVRVVAGPSGSPTPVKTRVRAGTHAVVRIDEDCGRPVAPDVTPAMLRAVAKARAIIVADYGRGLAANPQLRELLERLADDVPVVWDPHPSGAPPVPGVAVVTPNLAEAHQSARTRPAGPYGPAAADGAGEVAGILLDEWHSRAVLVTTGERGATLLLERDRTPRPILAPRVEAADPCGAGDRLAASVAVHLLEGRDLEDAAVLAVHEAADFLAAGGVASLPDRRGHGKVRHRPAEPLLLVRRVRENGGKVVATGGCFDLLHAGHVRSLAAARELGDCLIVCLNSDASVRRLKGDQRPIMGQQDRAELLLALECVDAVMIFDEDTPEAVLDRLRPDIWAKGGDYKGERLPEADLVESWGGRCVTVPYHPARSSTALAEALAKVS